MQNAVKVGRPRTRSICDGEANYRGGRLTLDVIREWIHNQRNCSHSLSVPHILLDHVCRVPDNILKDKTRNLSAQEHKFTNMADPFEVRMKFTHQLQHLNASVNSAQKAAHYAIRYKDMDEDLHSCILEQLERNNMNNRANIMFFIEQLCDMAQRENHMEFARMIQRDIMRIIDAVAPSDGSGAANIKVVRRVSYFSCIFCFAAAR